MQVSCPQCYTRYVVKAASIGAKGRVVKCAKCGHKWHQAPAGEEEQNKLRQFDEEEISDEFKKRLDDTVIPQLSEDAQRVVQENSLPVTTEQQGDIPRYIKLSTVFIILLLIPLSFITFRDGMIEQFPSTKSLYDAFGMTHPKDVYLTDMHVISQPDNTVVVEGNIINSSKENITIHGLKLQYFYKNGVLSGEEYIMADSLEEIKAGAMVAIRQPLKNISVQTNKVIIDIDFGNSLELLLY